MFTEKDLVAGETVLVWKESDVKVLYLGSAGLVNFISEDDNLWINSFEYNGKFYTEK